jgi:hypothetical protein
MKKAEIHAAMEAEVQAFSSGINRLTKDEVLAINKAEIAKYGPGKDALQGTRTEVSCALQLKNPAPHCLPTEHAKKVVSREERAEQHGACKAEVSDKHRLLSDHARAIDPMHVDAHHFAQKLHGTALWREVDRAIAEAGIGAGGVS